LAAEPLFPYLHPGLFSLKARINFPKNQLEALLYEVPPNQSETAYNILLIPTFALSDPHPRVVIFFLEPKLGIKGETVEKVQVPHFSYLRIL